MKKDPSKQEDTKTPMELTEEYLTSQVRHRAFRVLRCISRNDFNNANIEQVKLKTHIKTMNWLKQKDFISKWDKSSISDWLQKLRNEQKLKSEQKLIMNDCPVCGSNSVNEKSVAAFTRIQPYGSKVEYEAVENECLDCGEVGDFRAKNDDQIELALKESHHISVNSMLEYLSTCGVTPSYLERALELPARTVAMWKDGKFSAAAVALLKIIRMYPWILQICDKKRY